MHAALLGGGGFRVPLIHREIVASGLDVDELVLQDVDAHRLAVIAEVLGGDGPKIRTTTDLDEALDGADLVFAALRVGGVEGRVRDERDALNAGVLGQETVGAGGLAAALRAVPVVDHVAARIAARAPHAWTITMTNPAGVVTEAMAATLGERVIGVCDSPLGLVRRALAALGIADAEIDYVGLNHLGWLRAVTVDGVDLLPQLVHDPERLAGFEEGRLFGADLVAALGTLPNEYLYWYYAAREAHEAVVRAGRTRAEHVRDRQAAFYAGTGDAKQRWNEANDERNRSYLGELRVTERDEHDVATGGYESVAIALAKALTGGVPAVQILNVRNGGVIRELPDDAVIETVCNVDRHGAHPRKMRPLTLHELGLMSTVKDSERAIIDAARTGSSEAALRAFALHPLVGSLDAATKLAELARQRSGGHP